MITDKCTNVRITDVQMKNLLFDDTHLFIFTSAYPHICIPAHLLKLLFHHFFQSKHLIAQFGGL